MTSIIGIEVTEPYHAIILGADLQGNYQDQVEVPGAIILKDRKNYFRKISWTPDEAVVIAITGSYSPYCRVFIDALKGNRPDWLPHFDLIAELKQGHSNTVEELNKRAMTDNSMHIRSSDGFSLAVVYRSKDELGMWEVSEIGRAVKKESLAMGSGMEDLLKAYDVLAEVTDTPKEYKTQLSQQTYLALKCLDYATRKDSYSSGIDLLVISNQGISSITDKIRDLNMPSFQGIYEEVLKSLDKR